MTSISKTICFCGLLAFAVPATAQSLSDGMYIGAFGGTGAMIDGSGGSGPLAGVAIGARGTPSSSWAGEIEVTRREGDLTATGVMLNVKRDLAEVGPARVYGGVGLGAVHLDEGGDSTTNAAGQVMLGSAFDLNGPTELSLELRHVEAGDRPSSTDGNAAWTDLTAGIVLNF